MGRPSFAEKAIVAAKAAAADVARLSQEMLPSKTEGLLGKSKKKWKVKESYCTHNQSYKAHRTGIKKPKSHRHSSTKGTQRTANKSIRQNGEKAVIYDPSASVGIQNGGALFRFV
uniref:60S ribosomal protein L29 n=1 Tax=Solanum lycopersicum TaxID=4081 RepID=A0A3Q7IU97_SOLLC